MSKIEGCFLASIWLMTMVAAAHAITPPPPPVGYLPVVHRYVGGQYVGSVSLDPVSTYPACTEIITRVVGASAEDPSSPAGSSTRGGCVPIPPPVVAR